MHRRRVEKADIYMIVILNFPKFGRAVVCDKSEVDQAV
jgi:hypothetical protein